MTSPWILHVKAFQQKHGCSYKDAMTHSRASYTPVSKSSQVSGGKFNLKKAFSKGKRGLKSANHFYDTNAGLIDQMAGSEAAAAMHKARQYSEQADQLSGGKFNLKKAFTKGKKGMKSANHFYDTNAGLIDQMAGSEAAAAMHKARAYSEQADQLSGGKFNFHHAMRKAGHTVGKIKQVSKIAAPIMMASGNPALMAAGAAMETGIVATGGSFRTAGAGVRGGSLSCDGMCSHCGQGRAPLKPRGYSDPNR